MKKIIYILTPIIILISCTGNVRKNNAGNNNPPVILQTIAAFKNAEHIHENDWKLVFRKLDDCQYILLHTDIHKINSTGLNLVITSDNTYITNTDLVNLHYSINYSEEASVDPNTGEKIIINRLKDINKSRSGRFADAGFKNDLKADEFILELKGHVKKDSASDISGMILFPLKVVNKKKKISILDKESFIKDYNYIFNERVKNALLNQNLSDVKPTAKGLMIGNGEILINTIDDRILITSINN